jgi:hypothetical protein
MISLPDIRSIVANSDELAIHGKFCRIDGY